MAFRVTRPVLALIKKERNDVQMSLKKNWKYFQHTDGLVTRSISPYQVDLTTNFFKTIPMKLKHRWVEHGPEVLLALFASFGLMSIANAQVSRMEFEERD